MKKALILMSLVVIGMRINASDVSNDSALMRAVAKDNRAIVERLLAADPNIQLELGPVRLQAVRLRRQRDQILQQGGVPELRSLNGVRYWAEARSMLRPNEVAIRRANFVEMMGAQDRSVAAAAVDYLDMGAEDRQAFIENIPQAEWDAMLAAAARQAAMEGSKP